MEKSWEIDAQKEEVSLPHASLHCPEIHKYSHTQQFTEINCVIATLHSTESAIPGGKSYAGPDQAGEQGPQVPISHQLLPSVDVLPSYPEKRRLV
jgi:hypothetical protein